MKRSRLNHLGSFGLCRKWRVHRAWAIGAAPRGSPGWPLFAACTASMLRPRMVLMQRVSMLADVVVTVKMVPALGMPMFGQQRSAKPLGLAALATQDERCAA